MASRKLLATLEVVAVGRYTSYFEKKKKNAVVFRRPAAPTTVKPGRIKVFSVGCR